jgi:hypothetical protein
MTLVDTWQHRWFGLWRETGGHYSSCPSVYEFVNQEINSRYDIEKLCKYIESSHALESTSRISFPCVICGQQFDGSLVVRTDGVWWWHDDLVHYIRFHDLAIPTEMLKNIETNNYLPPPVNDEDVAKLERLEL